MQAFIYQCWFNAHPLRWLLLPLTLLFFIVSSVRKQLFKWHIKSSQHPAVPVLIVGNISVGGNGKTPVVLKCVQWLIEMGYKPGILSRGYGAECKTFPHCVRQKDTAIWVGDEPKLMANRELCPVVIDPIRTRGAKALVELQCNIIVCDDGLQHYALARDIEWVVMDDRKVGNGWLLPMGPLRELPSRLYSVDAVIHNGNSPYSDDAVQMTLKGVRFVNVSNPSKIMCLEKFVSEYADQELNAIAGIGSPQRFFSSLKEIGLNCSQTRGFSDHHSFLKTDIPEGVTLMTEKDAVKCRPLAHSECWYLEVEAQLDETLKQTLQQTLN